MGKHKPETKKRLQREYRERNKEQLRVRRIAARVAIKYETLSIYGTSCAVCGFDDPLALQIDHINNNGAEERKSLGGQQFSGYRFYRYLKSEGWPSGYQTLCANHNLIKYLLFIKNDGIIEE